MKVSVCVQVLTHWAAGVTGAELAEVTAGTARRWYGLTP
jgi:hypothetical protein